MPEPSTDINALIAEAGKDFADYQRLTAEGKLGEAGQKLDELEYEDEAIQADKGGQLHFRLSMPAWSLVLVKQM
jgi:hypothetical protein